MTSLHYSVLTPSRGQARRPEEAAGEPFAGGGGAQPARELMATIALASASCADYLTVTAKVLQARSGMYSLYTLARSALEAAAQACYLTEPGIEPLERVRRHMNLDLRALHENGRMLRKIADPPSVAKASKHAAQVDDWERWTIRTGGAVAVFFGLAGRANPPGSSDDGFLPGCAPARSHSGAAGCDIVPAGRRRRSARLRSTGRGPRLLRECTHVRCLAHDDDGSVICCCGKSGYVARVTGEDAVADRGEENNGRVDRV